MPFIVTDRVAWSVGLFVGLSHLVSPTKMAELIELPFRLRTRVGSSNHVLDGVQIPRRNFFLGGEVRPIVKYRDALP